MRKIIAFLALMALLALPTWAMAENTSGTNYVTDGESIFYRIPDIDNAGETWKMNVDGSGGELLCESAGPLMCVADGWLYMQDTDMKGKSKLHRVRADGTGLEALHIPNASYTWMAANDKAVFLRASIEDKPEILRFTLSPWKQATSLKLPGESGSNEFALADGHLYAVVSGGSESKAEFYRAKENGAKFEKLHTAPVSGRVTVWAIAGDEITYCAVRDDQGGTEVRRVRLDGSGDELLHKTKLFPYFLSGHYAFGSKFSDKADASSFYENNGFYQLDLMSGEMKELSKHIQLDVHPLGQWNVKENSDGWGLAKPELHKVGGTEKIKMPWPKQ